MIVYVLFLIVIFSLMIVDNFLITKNKQYQNKDIVLESYKYSLSSTRDNSRKLSYPLILAIAIIYIFSAFRCNIGWDYSAYYKTIESGLITNIISLGEYATIMLIELSQKTGITNIYFAINSFICIFFVTKTVKKYSLNRWLSLLFFICFPLFYLNSFSAIRIFTALSLTFYGFKYIESKNFVKYLLIVFLATMFHKSAFVAILLYFAAHYIRIKTSTLIVVLLSLPMISKIFQNVVIKYMPRYGVYFNITNIQEGTKAIAVFILIGIIAIVLRKKIINKDYLASLYYNIFFVGLAIYIAFIKQGTLGHRFSLYGTIYSLLLVPKIISLFKNPKERFMINSLVYILCITMFLLTVLIGAETYIPYKTIFHIKH